VNLAVSNLGWHHSDLEKVAKELKKNNISNIEAVFTKLGDWKVINKQAIKDFGKQIKDLGLSAQSTQSIFFNTPYNRVDENVINHFDTVIEYSVALGVKIIVFGSPTMRKKYDGWEISLERVMRYVDRALKYTDITMVIEPNSRVYGAEYFNTTAEIVKYIQDHKLNFIRSMIDTHNSLYENQDPIYEITKHREYIEHIHVSEQYLNPIVPSEFHQKFSSKLKELNYNKIITYEVKENPTFLSSIQDFANIYG
jgi:sugar phosphate isomerase/epimerase